MLPTRLPCHGLVVALAGEAGNVGLELGVVERALGRDGGVKGETGVRRLSLKGDGKDRCARYGNDAIVCWTGCLARVL